MDIPVPDSSIKLDLKSPRLIYAFNPHFEIPAGSINYLSNGPLCRLPKLRDGLPNFDFIYERTVDKVLF